MAAADEVWEALGDKPEGGGGHEHAVPHDRFDKRSYQEALTESSGLRSQRNWATREFDYAGNFLEDLFFSLLQGDPLVRGRHEMDGKYVPNREMVARFLGSTEWQELRGETAHHVLTSAMAMLSMNEQIRSALEAMQRARDLAEEAQQAQEAADAAQAAAGTDGEGTDGEDGDGTGESVEALVEAAAKAKQIAADAAEAAAAGMGPALRSAAAKATEEIKEENDLASAFGVEPGQLKRMDLSERAALMERLRRNRLVKFLDLIGAMRAMADAQWRRQVRGVPSQIAGITLGNDLTRVVASELVNLKVPALRMDFMRRYAEHGLMQWDVHDNERQGKGPIVLVVDESGSMESRDIGGVTREAWSKALALGISEIAKRQGRKFYYVGFSSPGQQWQIPDRDGEWTLESTLAMAEHFYSGGTHYERPLGLALGMAQHWFDQGRTRADIVFVSDDAYQDIAPAFLEEWREARARMSIGCHGVLIGAPESLAMQHLCDSVRPIAGIVKGAEVEAATSIVGGLL